MRQFKKLNQELRTRNLLAYFFESKTFKHYESKIINNPDYWMTEDPARAENMLAVRGRGLKGYTIRDFIYDVVTCVYDSDFSDGTKQQLFTEIDEWEAQHDKDGNLDFMV